VRTTGQAPFAKKSLGQNFLTDPNYIQRIIKAVDPKPNDTIFEIGPGRGALTEMLVDSGASIIAIELDRFLARELRERYGAEEKFQLIEQDALEVEFHQLLQDGVSNKDSRFKLVANLPYYISTAILQRLTQQRNLFTCLVLMFQKEVVDRITARPGNSDRGFLTVITEASFEVEKLFEVPPTAFQPVPKVQSAVVRLTPKRASSFDDEAFRKLVSTAFAQKRKNILNNLKAKYRNAGVAIEMARIDPARRAETLSLNEWSELYRSLRELSS
jgi:16S rRNA (adenine1518-N6/adenine1519-N6)-dimethyltransferase